MSEWYYSKDGAQLGPVGGAELKALLANGTLDANSALVWKSGMADWIPAAQVPELTSAPSVASDPYAAPVSGFGIEASADPGIPLPEIEPGSELIDAMACFKRGFDLAVRHIGVVLLTMVVFFAITIGVEILLGIMDLALGWGQAEEIPIGDDGETIMFPGTSSVLNHVLSHIVSVFLSLGLVRFSLNIVSGREASVGDMFNEGRLLLRGVVASVIFATASLIGFALLIAPGFYIVARYGFFMTAIVDRNSGIIEAFKYSSRITTNNRLNMVLVTFIMIAVAVLGCLALCVGILFAYPVILLAWTVAYRWLQYGNRAAMDHPGTAAPMLTPVR